VIQIPPPKRVVSAIARRGRARLAVARVCCERYALAAVGRRASRDGGRILCYHSFGQRPGDVNDITPARFRRQLEVALRAGYEFVPPSQIAGSGGTPKQLAVTFDDGFKSVATVAAPVLKELGIPWSLFVVSGWSEHLAAWHREQVLSWHDIAALAEAGAEIGSHSVTHPNFSGLIGAEALDELGESRRMIRARLGVDAQTFAVPFGQSANWPAVAAAAAREVGYSRVYAQAEHTRPVGTVARTFVTRFDSDIVFRALLEGAFDSWEEWF
jgi:peptidoglycan/xylan/chitin deacetylase (PgdA/CDA1 family)